MKVARTPAELGSRGRAVAIGTFDGVHLGHRQVLEALLRAGPSPTVITFWPQPAAGLGNGVELLTTLDRRLELLAEVGVGETVVLSLTGELARLEPKAFVEAVLTPLGAEVVVTGTSLRLGHGRSSDPDSLGREGLELRRVPLVEGVSSARVRQLVRAGEIERAAALLGRPHELDGKVVAGDARGGMLGFPTANLDLDAHLVVPAYGIYAGAVGSHRAAISVGTNPHYGAGELRIEAFLLDFAGDLYGKRLMVELWRRLRDERVFASEAELVAQIGRDVEETRAAVRPS